MDSKELSPWCNNPLNCPLHHFPDDFPWATEPSRTVKEVYEQWKQTTRTSGARREARAEAKTATPG
eukprot:9697430-Alexandrium_andersonii.AAC.1